MKTTNIINNRPAVKVRSGTVQSVSKIFLIHISRAK